jgi:hypothetical protein
VEPVEPVDPVDPDVPVDPEEMGEAVAVGESEEAPDPSDPPSASPGWHAVITIAADSAAIAITALRMLLFCMTSPELAVHGPDFAGARGGRQVRRTRGSARAPPVTER